MQASTTWLSPARSSWGSAASGVTRRVVRDKAHTFLSCCRLKNLRRPSDLCSKIICITARSVPHGPVCNRQVDYNPSQSKQLCFQFRVDSTLQRWLVAKRPGIGAFPGGCKRGCSGNRTQAMPDIFVDEVKGHLHSSDILNCQLAAFVPIFRRINVIKQSSGSHHDCSKAAEQVPGWEASHSGPQSSSHSCSGRQWRKLVYLEPQGEEGFQHALLMQGLQGQARVVVDGIRNNVHQLNPQIEALGSLQPAPKDPE